MNRYNKEQWYLLDAFAEVAPIIGADIIVTLIKCGFMHMLITYCLIINILKEMRSLVI